MNKILILLILATTIGYAQTTKIDKNITIDLEELNLKGNVKRVTIYEKTMDVDTTAIISEEKEFNESGFLLLEKTYRRGKLNTTYKYTYKDRKVETLIETKLPPYGYTTIKKYVYKDNVIEMKAYENEELTESFTQKMDKNNNIVYSKHDNYTFKSYCEHFYEYDNNNNNVTRLKRECYKGNVKNDSYTVDYTYKDNLLVKTHQSNSVFYDGKPTTEIYTYDKLNNYTELSTYINDILENKETKVYKDNLVLEHHLFDKDGVKTTVVNYEYDKNKNVSSEVINSIKYKETTIKTYVVEEY
ncbi:hypothetical protein [Cellulophaga sp. Asnod2-G02]|uniref:hypothetical protein n=1 Tax=Cellulophaga sp. Asnod2-G02 TaxID=3160572 RepID=UPI00386CAA13